MTSHTHFRTLTVRPPLALLGTSAQINIVCCEMKYILKLLNAEEFRVHAAKSLGLCMVVPQLLAKIFTIEGFEYVRLVCLVGAKFIEYGNTNSHGLDSSALPLRTVLSNSPKRKPSNPRIRRLAHVFGENTTNKACARFCIKRCNKGYACEFL